MAPLVLGSMGAWGRGGQGGVGERVLGSRGEGADCDWEENDYQLTTIHYHRIFSPAL